MIEPLIHQVWHPFSRGEMPREWRRFARSWQRWNPGHRHQLWGPEESRNFVADRHPDFLPTYDGYRHPIQRVHALQFLLLEAFGGICVDLDLECTRNVAPLLERQHVVLAVEPARHTQRWKKQGYSLVVSTAFMASERGHPFWSLVKDELVRSSRHADIAESTGGPLLTRCHQRFADRLSIVLLPPDHFSPFDELECRDHTAYDLEGWLRTTRRAFGVHHWAGSWRRNGEPSPPATRPRPLGLQVSIRHPELHRESPDRLLGAGPLVSCLMVSRGWKDPARWAIECFRRQTYRDRELVIVTANGEGDLREYVASLGDPQVRFAGALPAETRSGALRNMAVDHARGELLATWDDHELSGADRLATQVTALVTSGASAALLERMVVWWPARREVAISDRRPWEGTLLARRSALPRYREIDVDDAREAVAQLASQHSYVLIDDPNLHVCAVDGIGASSGGHLDRALQGATFRAKDVEYERALSVVSKHVPLLEYLEWLQERDPRTYALSPSAAAPLEAPAPATPGGAAGSRLVPASAEPLRPADPPLRFLFAWELGGGLGHTVPLSLLARPLLEAGHEVHLALLDLSTARAGLGELARHPGLHVWQAPSWPAPLLGHADSSSYAELLYRAGYLDAGRLSGLVDGWESLFRTIRPEMLLTDHAPTALLTARGHDFRRAMVGTGFFDPIPGSPMPTFREWEPIPRARLEEAERVVVATCNAILGGRGYPTLTSLQDLVTVDEHFLLTVPELDHFERRARDPAQRYYGTLPAASHGKPVTWPRGTAPAVFAYVKGEYEPIGRIIEALKASPWRVLAYLPGCAASVIASTTTERMTIVTDPVDMTEVCRSCDAIVCHSGSGTTVTALTAGKPLVMLPTHLEQYLVGRRIQSLGAGLVVFEDRIEQFPVALRRVVEEPTFRQAAEAFSRRYPSARGNRVAETVAARCQELALMTRAARAAQQRG